MNSLAPSKNRETRWTLYGAAIGIVVAIGLLAANNASIGPSHPSAAPVQEKHGLFSSSNPTPTPSFGKDAAINQKEKAAWLDTQPSVELIGKVEAVHPNGFVVKKAPDFISRTQMFISSGPPFYFVVAHPQQGQLAEGENITMFGVRDGSESIQTPNGQRVLARYHWMPTGKSLNR